LQAFGRYFVRDDAESLGLPDTSYDVVVNIESSKVFSMNSQELGTRNSTNSFSPFPVEETLATALSESPGASVDHHRLSESKSALAVSCCHTSIGNCSTAAARR